MASPDPNLSSDAVLVGTENELQSLRRKTCTVHGRKVTIFYNKGKMFAMDFHCYHSGGPLDLGNIEDINGVSCVICPWHKYKISLETGEGYYQSIDPKNMNKAPQWKSKGVKQRTHHVFIQNGNVYVTLSKCEQKLESDYYYSERYKTIMSSR